MCWSCQHVETQGVDRKHERLQPSANLTTTSAPSQYAGIGNPDMSMHWLCSYTCKVQPEHAIEYFRAPDCADHAFKIPYPFERDPRLGTHEGILLPIVKPLKLHGWMLKQHHITYGQL